MSAAVSNYYFNIYGSNSIRGTIYVTLCSREFVDSEGVVVYFSCSLSSSPDPKVLMLTNSIQEAMPFSTCHEFYFDP
jgi:hypothetical protein